MSLKTQTTWEKNKPRFDLGDTRFYEKRFPEKNDVVIVKVKRVAEMGAYVSLLEYNGLEGMILMSELSKRRIRSVKKIVRVGRHEVVLVLRVDQEKGYIDLSKKRVAQEDILRCEERFSKSKKVNQIISHVAQKHQIRVEELNKLITWPLQKIYGHALNAFRNPDFATEIVHTLDISDAIKQSLLKDINLRLASHTMRMRARIDLWCYGPAGVDAVRDVLIKGKEVASRGYDKADVKIKLIAPPQYTLITECLDKTDGEKRLDAAIDFMLKAIKEYSGGDGKRQGEYLIIGGEDEKILDGLDDENKSDKESSSDEESDDDDDEEEEEEDEGMGRIEDVETLPEGNIESDSDAEQSSTEIEKNEKNENINLKMCDKNS